MQQVGKIYELYPSTLSEDRAFQVRRGFKAALTEAGFRWEESRDTPDLTIHVGDRQLFCSRSSQVGLLVENHVLVYGSRDLEQFLERYDTRGMY